MKCPKQLELVCPFYNIGESAHPMVAFSGFIESNEPPPSGDALGIVPPHRNGHRNDQQSEYMLHHRLTNTQQKWSVPQIMSEGVVWRST